MIKLLKILESYAYPVFFIFLGLIVFFSNPNERISSKLPFQVGDYQYLVVVACFIVAGVLGLIIYRHENRKAKASENNK